MHGPCNAVRLTPYCALAGLMNFYFVLFDGLLPIADIFSPFRAKSALKGLNIIAQGNRPVKNGYPYTT